MIGRFSLYGFLKNQRYFEPFLLLALLEKGLGFGEIGVCIAVREVCINAFEIPSGALADVYGRRRSMVAAFLAYIASFVGLALGQHLWHFLIAMVLYGIGDAFRSGTHKAMILDWLRGQGREGERVAVYGYTRSWSKIGSAVSVPVGAALVWVTGTYTAVFWLAIVPYVLNVINLGTYPAALDGERSGGSATRHLREAAGIIWTKVDLRAVFLEAMAFTGLYKSVKDYLQPLLQSAALGLPVLLAVTGEQRTALLVGVVYVVLFGLEAVAARNAHRWMARWGDADRASRQLWRLELLIFAILAVALWGGLAPVAIVGFVGLAVILNLYRPLMVSRIDQRSEPRFGATLLSVESQAGAASTAILAPCLGFAVDHASAAGLALWPIGVVGVLVSAVVVGAQRPTEPG